MNKQSFFRHFQQNPFKVLFMKVLALCSFLSYFVLTVEHFSIKMNNGSIELFIGLFFGRLLEGGANHEEKNANSKENKRTNKVIDKLNSYKFLHIFYTAF